MRSIQKLSKEEIEVKELIANLKNTLTEIPYDFMYTYDNLEDEDVTEDNDNEEFE